LQSERFLTSYDPRDNNRSTEGRQEQKRQAENALPRGERENGFGGRILIFFIRRKKMIYDILMYQIIIYRITKLLFIIYHIKNRVSNKVII
jgi:hypothetical protein